MPEESAGGQGADGTEGQGAQGQQQGQEETFDKDRALNTIKAQREAEKALKAQVTELTSKLQAHETAKMSESEKLQKRLAELEAREATWQTERQELVLRSSTLDAARSAGARNPDAVWKLIDPAAVTFDDAGHPTNLKDLVDAVRKDIPELFTARNGSGDGGARPGGGKAINMNDWLRGKAALPSS